MGFTAVEIIVSVAVFGFMVIGITNAYNVIRKSYVATRDLNEIYAVLSACPELDRAIEYSILSNNTNCSPNNTFFTEGTGTQSSYSYSPTLTVTETSSLTPSDPLSTIPDSKVIDINVRFRGDNTATPFYIKMLITRNGVAQQ